MVNGNTLGFYSEKRLPGDELLRCGQCGIAFCLDFRRKIVIENRGSGQVDEWLGVGASGSAIRTLRDNLIFWGAGYEQDWEFLCSGDSVLSCIGHAKE